MCQQMQRWEHILLMACQLNQFKISASSLFLNVATMACLNFGWIETSKQQPCIACNDTCENDNSVHITLCIYIYIYVYTSFSIHIIIYIYIERYIFSIFSIQCHISLYTSPSGIMGSKCQRLTEPSG